ncbi:MAG: hypothetical protein DWH91_14065 [Planctomycetota bacterium]|nr:MAG: hypothetical protein DWH91_14065 [Planctomycetota bacterium]
MSSADSADSWPGDDLGPTDTSWLDRAWMWPLFGLIGLLVFEVTASSGMAIAIFCVKFGMKDVRLGLWLNRQDSNLERGRITGLLAASIMGLKITLLSLCVVVLLAILLSSPFGQLPQNRRAIQHSIHSVSVTTAVAMLVALAISSYGFHLARRIRQKVWLDNGLLRAPQEDTWPPTCFSTEFGRGAGHGRNTVIDLAQFAYLLQLPLVIGVPITIGVWFDIRQRQFHGWPGVWLAVLSGVGLVTWLMRRNVNLVAAQTPAECWPELLESHDENEDGPPESVAQQPAE